MDKIMSALRSSPLALVRRVGVVALSGILRDRQRFRRHFTFVATSVPLTVTCASVGVTAAVCSCAEMSTKPGVGADANNGLLLYYHQYSYYSQKVVIALHEKRLPFQSHIVNLTRGEQYEPWFLRINARGEVPVLQDTGKIIPDSTRIIDYLEDNFSNGDTPRLVPMDQGSEVRQRVTYFRQLIDKMPAGVLTMGSLFHPEFVKNPKLPFRGPVRKILANAERKSAENLRKKAERNPEARVVLLQKASVQETKHKTILNKEEFVKVLTQVDTVLDEVEKQLSNRGPDQQNLWLVTDRFTVADVALTIFLERLYELGFESRFWSNGRRPEVDKYFQRVRERDSYKKTIPNTTFFFTNVVLQQNPIVIGISVVAALALIAGGVFVLRKVIF